MATVIQDLSATRANWGQTPILQAPDLIAHIYGEILFPKRDLNISENVVNHGFTVADWTWSQRCAADLFDAISTLGVPSNPLLSNILETLSTQGASVVYQAFGTPSVTYGWTGILQMIDDYHKMTFSQTIGDTKGEGLSKLSMAQNAALAAGGLSFLGYRPTAIACAVEKISPSLNASSVLGRLTYAFVAIGMIFFSLCYLLISLACGIKVYQAHAFKEKLEKQGDVNAQIQFLMNRLDPDLNKLSTHHPEKYAAMFGNEKELIQEALSYGSQVIASRFKELSSEETVTLLWKQMTAVYGPNTEQALVNLGKSIRQKKWALKKEAKLARLTSAECVELIKKAKIDPSTSQAALDKVKATLAGNRDMNLMVGAACILGAICMVTSLFVTGGIGAIVIAAVMLAVCLFMFKVDNEGYVGSMEGAPGKYDKVILAVSMALCVLSILTVGGLMAAGLIAITAYPMIMTVILSSIWLVYNKEAWDALAKKERTYAEAHPTIDFLLLLLEEGADKRKIEEIRKKLQLDKENDLKAVALKTKEKISRMLQAEHERFLQALRRGS